MTQAERSGWSRHLRTKLRLRRVERGWTLQHVADLVAADLGLKRLSYQTIAYWESFDRHPAIDRFAAWCRVLGMQLDVDILDPDDDRVRVTVPADRVDLARAVGVVDESDAAAMRLLLRHYLDTPEKK